MSYGRNFEFRIHPHGGQRAGRYCAGATALPIGAPVKATGTFNALGLEEVALADTSTAPVVGRNGILVYEHKNAEAFAGDDTALTTYSDKGDAPANAAVQLVNGTEVKVVLRNVAARTFLNTRSYPARNMVDPALFGATPAVVGDYLEPHASPSDTNGYWEKAESAAEAWLVITKVDLDRDEIEARPVF